VIVAGQDLTAELLKGLGDPQAATRSRFAFGFIQTAGAGVGMLCFGPLSGRLGRRGTFALMHLLAAALTPVICWVPFWYKSYWLMLCLLPIFGFFAQGIHAGYAIYFPELFPPHLRATGAGFCFNTGRILAAPMLIWGSAELKLRLPLQEAVTWLGGLFVLGLLILPLLPETGPRTTAETDR
jgi:MFS family permease